MKNDYIMDMIEDFGEFLVNLKNKSSHKEEISSVSHDASLGEAGLVGLMLKRMCLEGKVNEAENLLFDTIYEHPEEEYFFVANDFYKELLNMSDDWLLKNNFSREEIGDGMKEILKIAADYGISQDDI
ncbi:MAG: hypothetical protein IJO86_04735 [Oscillospiraceae bacterium]|nr:hypothetical protein [Oscillospiraceae bacterium]